jgi:hypothetical protein
MLLMLALPLQAFAGAAMLDCMLAQPAAPTDAGDAGHDMAGCHEDDAPVLPDGGGHACAQCAACLLAGALPIPALHAAAVVPAARDYPSPPAEIFEGFLPEGPERPPRPRLA